MLELDAKEGIESDGLDHVPRVLENEPLNGDGAHAGLVAAVPILNVEVPLLEVGKLQNLQVDALQLEVNASFELSLQLPDLRGQACQVAEELSEGGLNLWIACINLADDYWLLGQSVSAHILVLDFVLGCAELDELAKLDLLCFHQHL